MKAEALMMCTVRIQSLELSRQDLAEKESRVKAESGMAFSARNLANDTEDKMRGMAAEGASAEEVGALGQKAAGYRTAVTVHEEAWRAAREEIPAAMERMDAAIRALQAELRRHCSVWKARVEEEVRTMLQEAMGRFDAFERDLRALYTELDVPFDSGKQLLNFTNLEDEKKRLYSWTDPSKNPFARFKK